MAPVEHFNTEATFISEPRDRARARTAGRRGYCLARADDHDGDGEQHILITSVM